MYLKVHMTSLVYKVQIYESQSSHFILDNRLNNIYVYIYLVCIDVICNVNVKHICSFFFTSKIMH